MMTLQIFRNLTPGPAPGNTGASRRDSLALGSLFNPGQAAQLKLSGRPRNTPETTQHLVEVLSRRTKIWELNASLHCSIVGTCLSNSDLRQVLGKIDIAGVQTLSDHDLHKRGVSLAAQRDGTAKLLQKALDRKHQRSVSQFERAKTDADIAVLWDEAVQHGEIPGAYWALLSHPRTSEALVKRAFGEVHMLSHLMGAANRADIRRLSELEAENAALQAKVARQQEQIRDVVVACDAKISDLNVLLARATAGRDAAAQDPVQESHAASALIATLERRLSSETSHRLRIEEKLKIAEDRLTAERNGRAKAEQRLRILSDELDAAESAMSEPSVDGDPMISGLPGQTILYVGGKTGHVAGLRDAARRFDANLLHHDGGLEDRGSQLAGLVSQAQIVFFPVDYVSHDAMHMAKRLCRQANKPYVPLRSAGLTSFMVALRAVGAGFAGEHWPEEYGIGHAIPSF